MTKMLVQNLRLVLVTFAAFGLAYSLFVLAVAQLAFPRQANGSLVERSGVVVGSTLIGQAVNTPILFKGRPSATVSAATGRPDPYNAANSGGSNLGPTNPALISEIRSNEAAIRPWIPTGPLPLNLVESSGSGLDPEITVEGALLEVPSVAKATGLPPSVLTRLIHRLAEPPFLGLYGPERINVLRLNLALIRLSGGAR